MIKTTLIAMVASLGLAANATSLNSMQSLYTSNSKQSVDAVTDSLNSTIAFSTDAEAVQMSFKASETNVSTYTKGVWALSTTASTKYIVAPLAWVSNETNTFSTDNTKYGSYDASNAVADSVMVEEASKSSNNVSGAYSDAASTSVTSVYTSAKDSIGVVFNYVGKTLQFSMNGAEVTVEWSANDFSNNPVKAVGDLTSMVWTGLSDLASAAPEYSKNLTVSVVKVSSDTFASDNVSGFKTGSNKTGTFWVILSAAGTQSYNNTSDVLTTSTNEMSEANVSGASEILLMLPLDSAKSTSEVSTSTRKDDKLGKDDIPDQKKN